MCEINEWIAGYKVRAFEWVDGKSVYLNMAYYLPGSSLEQPPAREKTVYLKKCPETERLLSQFLHSIVVNLMNGEYHG